MAKKIILPVILALLFIISSQSISSALDISLGGTVWYSWWIPSFGSNVVAKPQLSSLNERLFVDMPDYSLAPNVLYGPVLSIRFLDHFFISSVFVTGRYNAYTSGYYTALAIDYSSYKLNYINSVRNNVKYDSDTTLAYALFPFMRIFLGFKFQGYDFQYSVRWIFKVLTLGTHAVTNGTSRVRHYGPGLGVDFNIPLFNTVYLLASVSGIFMYGTERMDLDPLLCSIPPYISPSHYNKGIYYSYGGNASLSLAWHLEGVNTTLILGGRYQVLVYEQKKGDRGFTDFDGTLDHFFGITFSAVYNFSF